MPNFNKKDFIQFCKDNFNVMPTQAQIKIAKHIMETRTKIQPYYPRRHGLSLTMTMVLSYLKRRTTA